MRVLVVGANGMLGKDLAIHIQERGHVTVQVDLPEFDITDPMLVAKIPAGEFGPKFDWCVNCAAYTAVDKAEAEQEAAGLVNALGPGYLAQACSMAGIRLLHVSTDFVFDGAATEPYTEGAQTHPLGAYGKTKLEGEHAALSASPGTVIARTAWLYGPFGDSFPAKLIRAWLAGKELKVVADQTGSPTYTADLARVLVDLMEKEAPGGIYHTAGPEAMSWRDFTVLALEAWRQVNGPQDATISVAPIKTEDWPTPAKRPKYSVLSFEKTAALGIEPMRPVREALLEFVGRLDTPS